MIQNKPNSRLDIGPDGSLAMITSSVKENNIMIQQIPELNGQKPYYKIVTIGAVVPEESSSEISEEDDDIEISSIDISIESMKLKALLNEKNKDTSQNKDGEANNTRQKKHSKNNRTQSTQFKNFQSRDKFSRPNDWQWSEAPNSSSRNRNYYVPDNSGNNYRSSTGNKPNINPWLDPSSVYNSVIDGVQNVPVMRNEGFYSDFGPPLKPVTPSSAIESSFMNQQHSASSYFSPLLGNGPSNHIPHQFHQKPSASWNDPNIGGNSTYWNDGFANNYQRPVPPQRPVSVEQNHMERYQNNGSFNSWRGKKGSRNYRNRAKNKKWKKLKASSVNNRDGYRQWRRTEERE